MGGEMKKKGNKIRQIVRLKQLMTRWKHVSLNRGSSLHSSSSDSEPKPCSSPPRGHVFVYVGPERQRFVIPTRFLNLPIFAGLLNQTEEVFGLRGTGGLVLPCDVSFFSDIVRHLERNENKYGKLSLEEFVNLISEVGSSDSCKESFVAFTPLLQKARV